MSQPMLSSKAPFIHRARKAFNAGAMAFAGALATSLITAVQTAHVPKTAEGWTALVLSAIGIGVVAGWSTYKVRNTATVQGSDPLPARPGIVPPRR
jgi:hypothetical protein